MTDIEPVVPLQEDAKSPPAKKSKKPATPVKKTVKESKNVAPAKSKRPATTGKQAAPKAKRAFPLNSLEEARRLPDAIKQFNMGNPWAPPEIAKAIGLASGTGSGYFYLTTASRDYGLTVGTRDTPKIELTDLGRSLVYPKSAQEAQDALVSAFRNVELFKRVYDYYQGENLPDIQYLKNTLKTEFGLAEQFQDQFYELYP